MRVLMSGPSPSPLGRTILRFFYLYFFLHWGTGLLMFWDKLGFTAASVARYYRGDPDLFMNPRSFSGLLEVTHFHLFAMGLFFVVFCHLLLFTPLRPALKTALTWLLGGAILGDLSSGYLVRFLAAEWAWLKLGAFWLLQGVCLTFFALLFLALVRKNTDP